VTTGSSAVGAVGAVASGRAVLGGNESGLGGAGEMVIGGDGWVVGEDGTIWGGTNPPSALSPGPAVVVFVTSYAPMSTFARMTTSTNTNPFRSLILVIL
jgi:hypothetical protein